jgi:seryl-tRNA synthetase
MSEEYSLLKAKNLELENLIQKQKEFIKTMSDNNRKRLKAKNDEIHELEAHIVKCQNQIAKLEAQNNALQKKVKAGYDTEGYRTDVCVANPYFIS